MVEAASPTSALPVRGPLVIRPTGVLGSLTAAPNSVVSITPQISQRASRWCRAALESRGISLIDPGALPRVLLQTEANYPTSVVTKNLLRTRHRRKRVHRRGRASRH
jgi:hypothetical protein